MKYSLLLLLSVLFSCSSTQKFDESRIIGSFSQDVDFYGVGSKITLSRNNAFEYEWATGLINGITKGKWKYEKNNIVLNSEFQPGDQKFQNKSKIIYSEIKDTDSLQLKILDEFNDKMPYANCWLAKDSKITEGIASNLRGIAKLSKNDSDSLFVSFVGYDKFSTSLEDIEEDYLEIKLSPTDPEYEFYYFLTDKKFKFRRNKLIGNSTKYSRIE